MTRKTTFFEGCSWFRFNNLGLAIGKNLKFYTSVENGLKLKVRKFWGLIPTFVEVTAEKLVGGDLFALPILNRVKVIRDVNYYSKNTKAYWALLKIFLNNRKIRVIPPLFHNSKFITDFKEKAELFNSFFAKQCSLIKNESKLPPRLHFLTDKRLSMVKFVNNDILKIIQNLNPNKAHGHDKISIRMLKLCDD